MSNTLTFANQTILDANIYGGISYIADLNTGEEFSIGNTASASVEFVTDKKLPLFTKDSTNGTFTWTKDGVSRGHYYITEVTKSKDRYTVTAYDAMILLETNISALSLTLPMTASAIATAIATYIGCTVSGTITNGTLTVSDLDDDMSIRELLGYVAEASGCSVKIDGSDHICFMYYASSGITVTASDYKTIEVADYTCAAIDNVTIINTIGAVQATSGSGTNTLYIAHNPFLDEATATEAAAILANVSGLVYSPLDCDMFDMNGLEVGVTATFGTATTLVMHIEESEEGVLVSSIGSDNRAEYNKSADILASEAIEIANEAAETGQYFWHTSTDTGAGAGAHITETPKDTFLTNLSGGNLLARSNGIAVRDGLTELATFDVNGASINRNGTSVASFGETARIGATNTPHLTITKYGTGTTSKMGIDAYDSNNVNFGSLWFSADVTPNTYSTYFKAYDPNHVGEDAYASGISLLAGNDSIVRVIGKKTAVEGLYGLVPNSDRTAFSYHADPVGAVKSNDVTTSTPVTVATWSNINNYVQYTAGTWIIFGLITVSTNSTGRCGLRIVSSTAGAQVSNYTVHNEGNVYLPCNSSTTRVPCFAIIDNTTDTSGYCWLQVYSNISADVTASCLRAVHIF